VARPEGYPAPQLVAPGGNREGHLEGEKDDLSIAEALDARRPVGLEAGEGRERDLLLPGVLPLARAATGRFIWGGGGWGWGWSELLEAVAEMMRWSCTNLPV
jgi:hypothetical protein